MEPGVVLHDKVGRPRLTEAVEPLAVDTALELVAAAAAETVRGALGSRSAEVEITLCGDAEMTRLNFDHMGERGPTDVLSFPLLPPSAFRRGAPEPAVPRPPGTRIHLGDIVLSVERAIEQAASGRGGQTGDVRWSPADELRLLVTHGVLHICGWDHATPAEETAMRAVERRLLGHPSGGVDR